MVISITMLPPMLVSLIYRDGSSAAFVDAFLLLLGSGILIWLPNRKEKKDLRLRDGFIVVAVFWVVVSAAGSLPFILADNPHMTFTDAFFEAVSGLTTTGATVLSELDGLPHSILFYRQQLQWLGGMGIIVLAVAILPVLGIGGMQLYRAETPGPVKDAKLTPRIAETAKALWAIYLSITVACSLSYWLAGMNIFDAIGHAFATVSTGGFSTHDASFAYFKSPLIEMVGVVFMVLSGINFSLHYMALRRNSLLIYLHDREMRAYILIMLSAIVLVCTHLLLKGTDYTVGETVHHGIFQVVSFMTTSGFTTSEFYQWPGFMPVLLVFVGFIGGCAGSTAGGLKVIRVMLLHKQGFREITRLIHPSAWVPVKIGNKPQPYRVIDAVWGFFALYVVSFVILMLSMMEAGLDQISAFSAVAACINNVGPGLGTVATSFSTVSDPVKWLGCFAMLLGRLELFTLLVLITPAYWRS